MEKNRSFKIITILALVLAIISLSLGFAAYTTDVKYTPENIETKVEISEGLNYEENSTEIVYSTGKTNPGQIVNDVWSGIYFDVTGPGSYASVKARIKNVSSYDIYLYSLTSNKNITCEILDKNANYESSYIAQACKNIYLKIEVQNIAFKFGSTTNLNYYPGNILITKNSSVDIILTLVYPEDTIKPLESFKIVIPEIKLNFSTIN